MNKKRNWAIALVLSATAGIFALQTVSAPTSQSPQVEPLTQTPTITFTPTYEACGYMWAYHDDAELTVKLNETIVAMDPAASANAQLFGEDCVYADGHSTFGAMETDFYVRLSTNDLTDEEKLGTWIKQVMDVVTSLPDDEIQGNKGFVEFSFIKSDVERILIRVSINEYLNSPINTSGFELFQKYYTPTPPPTTPHPTTPTFTPTP